MSIDWEIFWSFLAAMAAFWLAWELIVKALVAKAAEWIKKTLKL